MSNEEKEILFTPQEISIIDKKIGFVVFEWAKHLINHVLFKARNSGIEKVYMNSKDTVYNGANDDKATYFYEKLPPQMGFVSTTANLRNKGDERLWLYDLSSKKTSKELIQFLKIADQSIEFNILPKKIQGFAINMYGRKPNYTRDEITRIIEILEKKQQGPKESKSTTKFYYDWSKEWSSGQRFTNITEMVVTQKLPKEIQNMLEEDSTLLKFWSLLLSQNQHFGIETIGFLLISPVAPKTWLINEIQTDCINKYLQIRNKYREMQKQQSDGKMTWETIKDMLTAQNKSKWIIEIEANETLKQQIINNPNIIQDLPNNNIDIKKWIKDRLARLGRAEGEIDQLFGQIVAGNFNSKIFRTY